MQFHIDGFVVGNPDVLPPSQSAGSNREIVPDRVDVLIVGCGPAGLTLAAQLAQFAEIDTCIVEQKPGPLELGQADGVACRTMEMFNAYGFAHHVLREAYWVNETTFWEPSTEAGKGIVRRGRTLDTQPGLSEFPHVILNQARVHQHYLTKMINSPSRLEPYYGRRLIELTIDERDQDLAGNFPVTARFEVTAPGGAAREETVRARFAVGCDGARSAVRNSLGLKLKGDSANKVWGVMDVLAVTDFPDIRFKAIVNADNGGALVLIPREGGYLARFYVEMDKLGADERVQHRNFTIEDVIAATNKVLAPYSLDVRDVPWWSVYEIGQRLCDRFDDLSDGAGDRFPRVFIAGDACHTHSPKAGQGMNVSMQDAFNLGWKLAAVLGKRATPALLNTYSEERQRIAKELIDFDREWAGLLSAAAKPVEEQGPNPITTADVQAYFVRHGHYTAGTATHYQPSAIVAEAEHQQLATGFTIGKRFHSAPVTRVADGKPMHLGHVAEADGRWRLYLFVPGGSVQQSLSAVTGICEHLTRDPSSPLVRHTPHRAALDAVFDVRAIFQQRHEHFSVEELPELLLPAKGRFGLRDYEKAFSAVPESGSDIFALRGIDRDAGCIVVVRPDQYVSHILPFARVGELGGFFARIMLEAERELVSARKEPVADVVS